jgi:hypothetical protein
MTSRRKLIVSRQRTVHSYAELWHASHCVLEVGLHEPRGSSWQFLSCAVLTAFTFEAYLNHIGPSTLLDWPAKERFAMWSKFKLLRKELGVTFPRGKSVRPLKTIAELFAFRDALAHGKSLELRLEKQQSLADFEKEHSDLLGSRLRTDWESRIQTSEFAERAREDVEVVIRSLDAARKDNNDILFNSGSGSHSAALLHEP